VLSRDRPFYGVSVVGVAKVSAGERRPAPGAAGFCPWERLLTTSRGVVSVEFRGRSRVRLNEVGVDGWLVARECSRGVQTSVSAFSDALRERGYSEDEARLLAEQTLHAFQERLGREGDGPRERWSRRLMLLHLLIRLPFFALGRIGRRAESEPLLAPSTGRPTVDATSPEYGAQRFAETSLGWVAFTFWTESRALFGIYGEDGWLHIAPGSWIDATESAAVDALVERGLPRAEAVDLGKLVIGERLTRIGATRS
jgi:hypothetical protein